MGAEIPIEFIVTEGSRTETITYSTGNTSTQEIQQRGTMSAVLTFDPIAQRPTAILFTSGQLYKGASIFTNTATINFYEFGKKKVTVVQSSSELQLDAYTIGAAHPVDSAGKVWETERLQTYPVAGTLTTKITIDGRTQTRTIDVATNPPDGVESRGSTDMDLDVVELEDHGSESDYKITFHASVDGRDSQKMTNTDTTVTTTTKGTTIAEAKFSAPNKFGQWLLNNGYSLSDEHSTNRDGVYLAALFAFNLSADDSPGFPWSYVRESGSLVLLLRLPDGGLEKAIQVESCDDLATGSWEALTEADFLDGNANLEQGASGTRRIRFPVTTARFYRIVPSEPDGV